MLLGLAVGLVMFVAVPASSQAALGDSVQLFVNPAYDQIGRSQLAATLRVQGERAALYVDDRFWNNLLPAERTLFETNAQRFMAEFDARIYPLETSVWGSEPNPGIDNDPRVVILAESLLPGYGGYFDGMHQFPTAQAPNSNRREMIFISADALAVGNARTYAAHEFQHLISFNQKEERQNVSEEVWLNELRSEYSTSLVGYNRPLAESNLFRRLIAFTKNPHDDLLKWNNTPSDYGGAMLLAEYLAGRYGQAVLADTLKAGTIGVASLDAWLAAHGRPGRFGLVVNDWAVANLVNKPGDARHGYVNPDLAGLKISPDSRQNLRPGEPVRIRVSQKPWESSWHEFVFPDGLSDGAARLQIVGQAISGQTAHPLAASVVLFDAAGQSNIRQVSLVTGVGTIYLPAPALAATAPIRAALVLTDVSSPSSEAADLGTALDISITAQIITPSELASARLAEPKALFTDAQPLVDGALIKRRGAETEVYVITGRYKRLLIPVAQQGYGHLAGVLPVEVDDAIFNSYTTANYIRPVSGQKVYAIWPDGTKHWLNMTGEYFTQSGRDWGAIFVVDDAEAAIYGPGSDITK